MGARTFCTSCLAPRLCKCLFCKAGCERVTRRAADQLPDFPPGLLSPDMQSFSIKESFSITCFSKTLWRAELMPVMYRWSPSTLSAILPDRGVQYTPPLLTGPDINSLCPYTNDSNMLVLTFRLSNYCSKQTLNLQLEKSFELFFTSQSLKNCWCRALNIFCPYKIKGWRKWSCNYFS